MCSYIVHVALSSTLFPYTTLFRSKGVEFGKLSGAVGTYANIDPFVEKYVCENLGLSPAPLSTQTLQRDRHAAYMSALALVATSIEKFATEIREIGRAHV